MLSSTRILYSLLLASIIWIFFLISLFSSPSPTTTTPSTTPREGCCSEYFSLLDYATPEFENCSGEEVLNCYAIYHRKVITGALPPHFIVSQTGTSLGWGNRFEQSLTTLFIAILTGRALIIHWPTSPPLSTFLNTTNFHINYDWSVTESYTYRDPEKLETVDWKSLSKDYFEMTSIDNYFQQNDLTHDISNHPVVTFEPNVFRFPFDTIYTGPFQHVIPKTLGNWKKTLMEYTFVVTNSILKKVEDFKKKMGPYSSLIGAQIRTFGSPSQTNPQVVSLWGCLDYFMKNVYDDPNIKLFMAADSEAHKEECHRRYPEKCYFSEIPATHFAGDTELGSDRRNDIKAMENILFDWWMFGEVEFAVLYAASSFGYTALDRTNAGRFIVGGLTQCVDPTDPLYYFEKIYVPLMVSYNKTGAMKYYPLQ